MMISLSPDFNLSTLQVKEWLDVGAICISYAKTSMIPSKVFLLESVLELVWEF